jgi:hypothetical protein
MDAQQLYATMRVVIHNRQYPIFMRNDLHPQAAKLPN